MTDQLSFDGVVIHDPFYSEKFLTDDECKFIIDWYESHQYMVTTGSPDEYNGIRLANIMNMEIRDLLMKAAFGIIGDIRKVSDTVVYPEMVTINRWHVRGFQPPHTDLWSTQEMMLHEMGYMQHTPSRQWTCIYYLNDDFSDGQTYVPADDNDPNSEEVVYEPKVGQGLVFQGIYVQHGVKKVRRTYRYTISFWFTTEYKKMSTGFTGPLEHDEDLIRLVASGKPIPCEEEKNQWVIANNEREQESRAEKIKELEEKKKKSG